MTIQEFIYKALADKTTKNSQGSVFIDNTFSGGTMYSYGSHYPLVRIIEGYAFVNNAGYSMSTSKHISWARQAACDIVSASRVYHVPLTNGDSLTKQGIMNSATTELNRVSKIMSTKKRKDTMLYAGLEAQRNRMSGVIHVARQLS
jgi:hypothetical protein